MDLYLTVAPNGVESLSAQDGSNFYRQSNIHPDFDEVKNDPANTVEPYPVAEPDPEPE